jgi:hypothetical protein
MPLTARYTPSWVPADNGSEEEFLGYVGELDVYYQDHRSESVGGHEVAYIVGPSSRMIKRGSPHNFDPYKIENGALELHDDADSRDVHIELEEMCLLYQLLDAFGLLNKEEG